MGVRFPSVFSTTLIAVPPASGVETVVVTTPPLTLPFDFATVLIFWYMEIAVGAGTTGVFQRIHRGTSTVATIIAGGGNINFTGGQGGAFGGCCADVPGAVGGVQYSYSIGGAGTTGAWGSGSTQYLLAMVL